MTDLIAQRLIAAIENNTATLLSMHHSSEAVLLRDGPDNHMVTAPALAKALGLDASTCRRKMYSGEWPSKGYGRNRRANLAIINQNR